jgi:uncharacterized protein YfdQ (DUF2303 family)
MVPDEIGNLAAVLDDRAQPKVIDVNDVPLALVPKGDGYEVKSLKPLLDEYASAPDRREGTASLHTLDALIAHVNRAKDENSVAFVDGLSQSPSITVVYDYHAPGQDTGARFGRYRAQYAFPVSEEWQAWRRVDGQELGQAAFARFIDEHLADIADPNDAGEKATKLSKLTGRDYAGASRLVELASGLEVNVKNRVANAVNLSTGELSLTFAEEHSDTKGAPLRVARAFLIAVPVFRNGDLYQIPVQIQYRVKDGAVLWTLRLHQPQRCVDDAVGEAAAKLREGTGIVVLEGTPDRK